MDTKSAPTAAISHDEALGGPVKDGAIWKDTITGQWMVRCHECAEITEGSACPCCGYGFCEEHRKEHGCRCEE